MTTKMHSTDEHLERMNISLSGFLRLKGNFELRAAGTDSVGEEEHWSADGLYRHLCLLEGLVPRTNEAATRLWTNAVFFRVASMASNSSKIILNVEHSVMSHNYLSGFVNFTAISTTKQRAEFLLENPRLRKSEQDHALFVTETKGPDQIIGHHVPQAICEMYACAKRLEKTVIRGAVTNGRKWVFLVLKLNRDGNGGKYLQSAEVVLYSGIEGHISRESCSVITGIIKHWIEHSHEEIGIDDYFEGSMD